MPERRHLEGRLPCPLLPPVSTVITAEMTSKFAGNYNAEFYLAALHYAQSLWLEGKAAQCLLQLNKALMADLGGESQLLLEWPLPYAAKRWVMESRPAGEFIGNPVRHYQHLASRMSGPRAELRSWRAWACLHLAETVLPFADFPRDERQIEREQIVIPERKDVLAQLARLGLPGESEVVEEVLRR